MSIANYIKDDLKSRLRSGRGVPSLLTIDSLAELYNVSFTPVRTAIASLIDDGVLEKGANRRLIVNVRPDAGAGPVENVPPPTPPRDLYEVIVTDMLPVSLQGRAVYLREEATAEKYNASRSAIRNIFHRLAGEGVLDHIPRRGWRLRAFSQDDLKSYVEIREALELKALALAFPKLQSCELQRMFDLNRLPSSEGESPQVDESLHVYLIQLSGNHYISEFFDRQGRYYRLLFQWEDHDRQTAIETVQQHHKILGHLMERDEGGAREALSYHILNNHPILTQKSDSNPSQHPVSADLGIHKV